MVALSDSISQITSPGEILLPTFTLSPAMFPCGVGGGGGGGGGGVSGAGSVGRSAGCAGRPGSIGRAADVGVEGWCSLAAAGRQEGVGSSTSPEHPLGRWDRGVCGCAQRFAESSVRPKAVVAEGRAGQQTCVIVGDNAGIWRIECGG